MTDEQRCKKIDKLNEQLAELKAGAEQGGN